MKNNTFCLMVLLLLAAGSVLAQTEAGAVKVRKDFTIKAKPKGTEIIQINSNGSQEKIGIDTADVRIDKDEVFSVLLRKEGYKDVRRSYQREKGGIEEDIVVLATRVLQINATPPDAHIFVNNDDSGASPVSVVINKDESAAITVKKPGFKEKSQTFYNKNGQDVPPISATIRLEDRIVAVTTVPKDAGIATGDKAAGTGAANILIKKDSCVPVTVSKPGYVDIVTTYCNKESEPDPPLNAEITLKDREALLNVVPSNARILVDGAEMAKASYKLVIPLGKCVEVGMDHAGYVPYTATLCNQPDKAAPEALYTIRLAEDEAYTQSLEKSDVANKNFNVPVSAEMKPLDSWKILSSIISGKFNEMEVIDANTSYLKTNWVTSTVFNAATPFPRVIRTKVIVTLANSNPLTYNVMIKSELSKLDKECTAGSAKVPTASRDECFDSFPRILRQYSDLINELQSRLMAK